MNDSTLNSLAKLISEFSLKQLPRYIIVGILICLIIGFYETYTDQFKLMRLQRTTELTEKLAFIEREYNITQNNYLKNSYEELTNQLNKILLINSSPEIVILNQKIKFAFAGASLWILFSLLFLTNIKKEKNEYGGMVAALLFGIIAGTIGFKIPKILNGYFNYIIYPIGNFILVVGLVMAWYSKKNKPTKST
ncbi:MAG: hypothetical protein PHW62_02900 [Candidatus Ratteibacteria bacterium]|nr:hypothetical protein [Candidatus Ratteibacteria bacterium]